MDCLPGTSSACDSFSGGRNLLTLPDVVLDRIYDFLPYDDMSKTRRVCMTLDRFGQRRLNHGFSKLQVLQKALYKDIKAQLPRRESQRHSHALARHMEVLTSVGTRLCLLDMTYGKYIKDNACCFIPGKVLDEAYRLLCQLQKENSIARSFDVIQELRDISGMAMEHFEENIAPRLTSRSFSSLITSGSHTSSVDALRQAYRNSVSPLLATSSRPSSSASPTVPAPAHVRHPLTKFWHGNGSGGSAATNRVPGPTTAITGEVQSLRRELQQLRFRFQRTSTRCLKLKAEVQSTVYKYMKQGQQIAEMKEKLAEQKKFTESLAARLSQLEPSSLEVASSSTGEGTFDDAGKPAAARSTRSQRAGEKRKSPASSDHPITAPSSSANKRCRPGGRRAKI